MSAPTIKTLLVWLTALVVWLLVSALLESMGMPSIGLLFLHLAATGVLLWRILRLTAVVQAQAFLVPDNEGPTALTPYGSAAAWLSGFGTIGVMATVLMNGSGAFALVVGIVGGMIIASTVLAPALAEVDSKSLSGWVGWRFGERAERVAKGLLAVLGIGILTVQMAFAALVAQAMFGISPIFIVPIVAVLTLLAVLGGGIASMIPAQAMLFLVLFAGVLVPGIWLGLSQTGIVVPHLAPGAMLHEIAVAESRLGIVAGNDPFAAMMLGLTVMLGTLALPHTLVRWPVERSGHSARYFAQRGAVLAVIVIAAVPLLAIAMRAEVLIAAMAGGAGLSMGATPADAIASGLAILDPPAWLVAALGAGILAAIVAACASATLLVASALGRDPARETAGGVLSRLRWVGALSVGLGACGAMVLPVDPVTAFLALLAFAASAILAPFVLGLMWSGMTAGGALAGMIAGAVSCVGLGAMGWSAAGGMALLCLGVSASVSVAVSLVAGTPKLSPPIQIPPRR